MKRTFIFIILVCLCHQAMSWGFFAHRKINFYAVFLLPPQMLRFYKTHIDYITEHAVDPDKRRYMVAAEGARHYIDIDHYGAWPYPGLPHKWHEAVTKFTADSLRGHGIVPWWIQIMLARLTDAFQHKNVTLILKYSAEIGHYVADAHVPLHTNSNHNGQLTGQQGIHAFWESRIPELLADNQWDFFIGQATYIRNPEEFIWKRVLESAIAADSVLKFEAILSKKIPPDKKYSFEERNGVLVRQYSSNYSIAFDRMLDGMIERRMRESIQAVASCWFTAWVDAGQPDLSSLLALPLNEQDLRATATLDSIWRASGMQEHE